jgi:hypothetical protein
VAPPARLATEPLSEDTLGLPRRVRYDEQVAAAAAAAEPTAATSTPEEIGALVTSLQQGWLGGRNQAAQQEDDS